jgi:benzoate membrane transport protein
VRRIPGALGALDRYQAPAAAGVALGVFGVFGVLPVLLGLAVQLGLDQATTTSWIFASFFLTSLLTAAFSLLYREPYTIGWNVPAALLLGAAGARYGWPALLGASAVAGLVIAVGSMLGLGRASLRFLPLPLVMGMFAGSILRLATEAFAQLGGDDPLIALGAIVGYFATRLLFGERVPPTIGAILIALAAAIATGRMPALPPLVLSGPLVVAPSFELAAIATLVPPLVLLVVGTGNVQALGFLRAQGFRPPMERLTFAVGALTILNAFLGASPAGMARVGAAIVGGPEAGRREHRWVGSVVAAALWVPVALLAVPVAALSFELPRSLVATVAGLAIVGALLEALRIAFTSRLAYSAFFAFVIAFSPFAPLGLEAAFWSLLGSLAIALLFEREALRESLRADERSGQIG